MSDRIFVDKRTPTVFKALGATAAEIRTRAHELGLEHELLELVNIRASQLNGCAYCLDLHTQRALEGGAAAVGPRVREGLESMFRGVLPEGEFDSNRFTAPGR